MYVLLYLSELDKLSIVHTTDSFKSCSKSGLVKGIWSNHSHEPKVYIYISLTDSLLTQV